MKRILYVAIFLICFNILQSVDVTKIKNKHNRKRVRDVHDVSEDRHRGPQKPFKRNNYPNLRRAKKVERTEVKDISSSIEKMKYQDEFRELHRMKKQEAFNTSTAKTDVVNMVAARPWGVPCGDPDQHDMPWGSCLTPQECEAEYRIPRGDYFCGRTTFVCCALTPTTYDLYGPLDASFGGSDFEAPSAERLVRGKGSSDRSKKSRNRDENHRQREEERKKRKKRMKKVIRKIVREIERSFKNESKIKRDKTRHFKKYLKQLKKKFIKSRLMVKDQHGMALNRTDREGEERLDRIYQMNKEFVSNLTDLNLLTHNSSSLRRARRRRRPRHRHVDVNYDLYT